MTSSHAGGPGWYSDPTGIHELRYFDATWTDFVVNRGVQSVSPMPPPPQWTAAAPALASSGSAWPVGQGYAPNAPHPARRNNKKVAWIVTGAVTAGVAVVAISVAVASSGGSGSSGDGNLASFCRDFDKSWSQIAGGELTVTVFVDTIDNDPTTFSGGDAQETTSVTVASRDADVLAKETPGSLTDVLTGDSVKTEIASLDTFLLAGVKMAHGDASAAASAQSFDDTFMGSVAAMAATSCPQH